LALDFDPALRVIKALRRVLLLPLSPTKEVAGDYGTSITAGERSGLIGSAIEIGSDPSSDSLQAGTADYFATVA
jgi:hypothetical protein